MLNNRTEGEAAGAVHRHPFSSASTWSTRHLLFGALFASFCLLLAGVALGCYLMIQHDFRWKTYGLLHRQVMENWQPRPDGFYLLMPSNGRPNWLRLSDRMTTVRYYDPQARRKVQMGGPPELPAECPLEVTQVANSGRPRRYTSHNGFENWLLWALPVHDLSGRVVGVLELGMGTRPYDELLTRLAGSLLLVACLGMGVSSLMAAVLSNYLARPLESLAAAIAKVRRGNFCARAPVSGSREMQSVAGDFNEMVDQLGQVFEAQKRFIADASHELKTPLTSITTMTDLLQHQGDALKPERQKRAWEVVAREIDRMQKLVQDLLTLSRFDQAAQARREIVDLSVGLSNLLDQYPRVQLRGQPEQGLIRGDSAGWERCLRNLFENAQAHTHEHGQIWVSLQADRGGFLLTVEDEGCGIPTADLSKVTQRFFRSERSRSRHLGGTGLGLSIVSAWVERAGGKLELKSQVGKGTCVKIWIPAR